MQGNFFAKDASQMILDIKNKLKQENILKNSIFKNTNTSIADKIIKRSNSNNKNHSLSNKSPIKIPNIIKKQTFKTKIMTQPCNIQHSHDQILQQNVIQKINTKEMHQNAMSSRNSKFQKKICQFVIDDKIDNEQILLKIANFNKIIQNQLQKLKDVKFIYEDLMNIEKIMNIIKSKIVYFVQKQIEQEHKMYEITQRQSQTINSFRIQNQQYFKNSLFQIYPYTNRSNSIQKQSISINETPKIKQQNKDSSRLNSIHKVPYNQKTALTHDKLNINNYNVKLKQQSVQKIQKAFQKINITNKFQANQAQNIKPSIQNQKIKYSQQKKMAIDQIANFLNTKYSKKLLSRIM